MGNAFQWSLDVATALSIISAAVAFMLQQSRQKKGRPGRCKVGSTPGIGGQSGGIQESDCAGGPACRFFSQER